MTIRQRFAGRVRAGLVAMVFAVVVVVPAMPGVATPGGIETAGDSESVRARTSVSEVVNHRFADGDPGGLGYKVTHEVLASMAPEDTFPSVRIDPTEHPDAFEGQWADAGFHAAWVAPKTEFQFWPDAYTVEGGYFDNMIRSDGAPLTAGDSVEIAVKQLAGDSPLTWDKPRGDADGEPAWEVATHSQTIAARYGGAEGEMDVMFLRADLVARGGDFDARDSQVRLPTLVVDLPKTYGPETRASAAVSQFAPYLHYIRNVEGVIVPQSGKAIFDVRARGYIPEAVERDLPGGTHIREWHIPLNIVIALTDATGVLGGETLSALPGGGVVWTFDGATRRRIEVPAGGRVLTRPGSTPRVLGAEGDEEATSPVASVASAGTLMDDVAAAAAIDHALATPRTISIGKRSFDLTIDPDINGSGTLGIRNFDHLRPPRGFFETSAIPYVMLNGELITLDRSRLVDLRVIPFDWMLMLGFSSRTDGSALDPTSYVTSRVGRINRTAAAIEAVYDLGDNRYGFMSARSYLEAESDGESVDARLIVRSFDEEPADVSAVQYMELSEPGPITYDDEVMTTEFSGPTKALRTPSGFIIGGATGGSHMTVVRAGAPIGSQPVADPSVSIVGEPIGLYLTSPTGSTDGTYGTVLISLLDEVTPQPQVEVAPIGRPCGAPPVVDDAQGDAAVGLDVTRAWFDFDGANLHSTIEVARLDDGVVGSPATFRAGWRLEHIGWGVQAERDVAGNWNYRFGLHSSAGAPWGAIGSVPVTGQLEFGSPGYIRMSSPGDAAFSGAGFLSGEMLRDTGATSFDANGVQDRAPAGATDVAFGRGGDYVIATCSDDTDPTPTPTESTAPETTATSFTARSQQSGQYSDATMFESRVVDSAGDPIVGDEVTFELAGAEVERTFSATTNGDGIATVTPTLADTPGTYQLTARYGGDDAHEGSADTTTFVIAKEDSAAALTVTGKGKNRTLRARLADADADTPVVGRTIDFYADGALIGSATTTDVGIATLEPPPRYRGKHDFEALFEGDDYYLASSDARRE